MIHVVLCLWCWKSLLFCASGARATYLITHDNAHGMFLVPCLLVSLIKFMSTCWCLRCLMKYDNTK